MKSKVVETLATGCESFAADARAKIYTQWVSKRRRCLKAGALRAEDQRGRQDKYHPEVSVCSQSAALKALLCSFRRLSKGGRGLFLIIANTFHFFLISNLSLFFIFSFPVSSKASPKRSHSKIVSKLTIVAGQNCQDFENAIILQSDEHLQKNPPKNQCVLRSSEHTPHPGFR